MPHWWAWLDDVLDDLADLVQDVVGPGKTGRG